MLLVPPIRLERSFDNLLIGPSFTPPHVHRCCAYTKFSRPFSKAHSLASGGIQCVVALVVSLFNSSRPPTILRTVPTVVINAFNRMGVAGSLPHIGKEIFKRSPSFANGYPATAIAGIFGIQRVITPPSHPGPNYIFLGVGQSMCITVGANIGRNLLLVAPTRFCESLSKCGSGDNVLPSTITNTTESCRSPVAVLYSGKDRKTTEPLASNVLEAVLGRLLALPAAARFCRPTGERVPTHNLLGAAVAKAVKSSASVCAITVLRPKKYSEPTEFLPGKVFEAIHSSPQSLVSNHRKRPRSKVIEFLRSAAKPIRAGLLYSLFLAQPAFALGGSSDQSFVIDNIPGGGPTDPLELNINRGGALKVACVTAGNGRRGEVLLNLTPVVVANVPAKPDEVGHQCFTSGHGVNLKPGDILTCAGKACVVSVETW